MADDISQLRRDYRLEALGEEAAAGDPIEQFGRWWREALAAEVAEPNAMTLATADVTGRPSARIVLLKGFDDRGFTFYTNYESRKGRELAANSHAALVFFWVELERQVRIEGIASQTTPDESDAYFASRPLGSRIGAIASHQSEVLGSREPLEARVRELEAEFAGGDVPRPAHWGGYRVAPDAIEFWQGRSSRLHDRLRYRRGEGGAWIRERLSP
jgi:pyridoxamine 5'-phosphate oxidase